MLLPCDAYDTTGEPNEKITATTRVQTAVLLIIQIWLAIINVYLKTTQLSCYERDPILSPTGGARTTLSLF
jgi:hypothetical protein